jgi:predicted GIY-YIG superfamily endonuclease
MASDVPGTVYLLHLDPPYKHARHYLGWAADLAARMADHAEGRGARLLAVQKAAGGTWHLTRTWTDATRSYERRIKNTGHVPHYCPACQPGRSAARRTARQTQPKGIAMARTPLNVLSGFSTDPDGPEDTVAQMTTDLGPMANALMETAAKDIAAEAGGHVQHVPSGISAECDREAG